MVIALANGERATFDTTDGEDAPITELQIQIIKVAPKGRHLADVEPSTGVMRRIEDTAGRLVGVNLVDLRDGFVLKVSWKSSAPRPEPSGAWQDSFAALIAELVAAPTAADCQDGGHGFGVDRIFARIVRT